MDEKVVIKPNFSNKINFCIFVGFFIALKNEFPYNYGG